MDVNLLSLIGETSAQMIIYGAFIWIVWWFFTRYLKQRHDEFEGKINQLLENANREREAAASERQELIFRFESALEDERKLHKGINEDILTRMEKELSATREQHMSVQDRIARELRSIHDMHARIVSIIIAMQSSTAEDANRLYDQIILSDEIKRN